MKRRIGAGELGKRVAREAHELGLAPERIRKWIAAAAFLELFNVARSERRIELRFAAQKLCYDKHQTDAETRALILRGAFESMRDGKADQLTSTVVQKLHRRAAIASLCLFATLLAALLCASASTQDTRQARSGDIHTIVVTRLVSQGSFFGTPIYAREISRVQIYLRHRVAFDGSIPSHYRSTYMETPPNLITIVSLAPGPEPQVLVRSYTAQIHCCYVAVVFDYNASLQRYVLHGFDFENMPYEVRSLSPDSYPRFVSHDDRFSYQFTSFAGSRNPLRILAYRSGRFVDVTDCYPSLIREDAATIWAGAQKARPAIPHEPGSDDLGAALAAWAADEYRLGAGDAALAKVRTFPRIQPNFVSDLTQFLQKTGYVTREVPKCT